MEIKEIIGNNFGVKNPVQTFICEQCDFNCCTKFNWERHLMTSKHLKRVEINNWKEQKEQKEQKIFIYVKIVKKNLKLMQDYGNIIKVKNVKKQTLTRKTN